MDVADGLVFGSWDLEKGLGDSCFSMVFMPIGLGGIGFTEEQLVEDPRFPENTATEIAFYEYFSEAGPRAINGYPIFFSCSMLMGNDIKKVLRLARKFLYAKEAMVRGK